MAMPFHFYAHCHKKKTIQLNTALKIWNFSLTSCVQYELRNYSSDWYIGRLMFGSYLMIEELARLLFDPITTHHHMHQSLPSSQPSSINVKKLPQWYLTRCKHCTCFQSLPPLYSQNKPFSNMCLRLLNSSCFLSADMVQPAI